jgi:hypothetical protein
MGISFVGSCLGAGQYLGNVEDLAGRGKEITVVQAKQLRRGEGSGHGAIDPPHIHPD